MSKHPNTEEAKLTGWEITGIVFGAVVFIGVVIYGVFWCKNRGKPTVEEDEFDDIKKRIEAESEPAASFIDNEEGALEDKLENENIQ